MMINEFLIARYVFDGDTDVEKEYTTSILDALKIYNDFTNKDINCRVCIWQLSEEGSTFEDDADLRVESRMVGENRISRLVLEYSENVDKISIGEVWIPLKDATEKITSENFIDNCSLECCFAVQNPEDTSYLVECLEDLGNNVLVIYEYPRGDEYLEKFFNSLEKESWVDDLVQIELLSVNNLLKESVKKKLSETSKTSKFKQYLMGTKQTVYTFAIGTPENPNGEALSEEENKKRLKDFENDLKEHKLFYKRIKGKFDNEENSYLIININLNLCKYLFGKYGQYSFIFASVKDALVYDYYSMNDRVYDPKSRNTVSDYIKTDTEVNILNKEDADNYYSSFKGYKYTIPFRIFDNDDSTEESNDFEIEEIKEALISYGDLVEKKFGWNKNLYKNLKESATSNFTPGNTWRFNKSHFLTEEQERKRLSRVSKVR